MIARVMTTRRAGRPIDLHSPTRLKSIGVYFLRRRFPNCPLEIKGGRNYTGGPSLSTRPSGARRLLFPRGRRRDAGDRTLFRLLDWPHYIMKSARAPHDAR